MRSTITVKWGWAGRSKTHLKRWMFLIFHSLLICQWSTILGPLIRMHRTTKLHLNLSNQILNILKRALKEIKKQSKTKIKIKIWWWYIQKRQIIPENLVTLNNFKMSKWLNISKTRTKLFSSNNMIYTINKPSMLTHRLLKIWS